MPLSNSFLFPRDISTLVFCFLKRSRHSWFTAGSDMSVKWGLQRPVSLGSCSHCLVSLCARLSLSILTDALGKVPVKFPQGLGWRPLLQGLYVYFFQGLGTCHWEGTTWTQVMPEVARPTQLCVTPGCLPLTLRSTPGSRLLQGGGLSGGSGVSSPVWGPVSLWAGGKVTLTDLRREGGWRQEGGGENRQPLLPSRL